MYTCYKVREMCSLSYILKRIPRVQSKGTHAIEKVSLLDWPESPRVDLSEFKISEDISYESFFADVRFAIDGTEYLSFVSIPD